MKVELFALCDAASDAAGKLSILGIFDTINTMKVPFVHPRCAIVLKLRFERIERGKHMLKFHIIDQDGKPVIPPLEAPLEMNFPDSMSSAPAQLVLEVQNLRFVSAGEFSIELAIDGRQEASIPLFVRNADAASPLPSGGPPN